MTLFLSIVWQPSCWCFFVSTFGVSCTPFQLLFIVMWGPGSNLRPDFMENFHFQQLHGEFGMKGAEVFGGRCSSVRMLARRTKAWMF